ncbi:MAG: hypothetical protein WA130_07250 [Candidatus Methanoperedens sp.]
MKLSKTVILTETLSLGFKYFSRITRITKGLHLKTISIELLYSLCNPVILKYTFSRVKGKIILKIILMGCKKKGLQDYMHKNQKRDALKNVILSRITEGLQNHQYIKGSNYHV